MKNNRCLLVVETPKESVDRAFAQLKKPSGKYKGVTIIAFPDFETLGKVVTGARLELLAIIRQRKPKSIQELARFVKRDFKNVYQDIKILADFGLIQLVVGGPRRAAAPVAKFSELVLAA